MKKFLPLTLVPVVAAFACTPDIAQDTPADTSSSIEVLFDPAAAVPVVPAPNDLAKDQTTGKLHVPNTPGASEAQVEFNAYLNTLDNFPFESTGSVTTSGDLDPATVTPANVIVLDITNPAAPVPVTGYTPSYANKTISVAPPNGAWTRAHHYAVALYAGDGGLKGAAGQPVRGSATYSLVSGESSLVTCADLKTNCRPTVDIIPSTELDPEKRLADQTAKALQLEQIRQGYKPILDGLAAQGKPRSTIPIVWTFGIADAGEVLFDPAHNVIPFPNNVLLDTSVPAKKHIKLPNPKTFMPLSDADCAAPTDQTIALVCGLNTLDGFSTTVPPQSENSNDEGALAQGTLDAASLTQATVGLARLTQDNATSTTDPNWQPCINCATSNKDATTQTLQWNLLAPLDERSTYIAYVTTDAKDSTGKNVISNPVFALARSSKPLVGADGKTAVSIISDAQATQLEPLRAGMAPALDALAAKGLTRDKIALAFAFSTQSEGSVLDQLRMVPPGAIKAGVPDVPVAFGDATTIYQALAAPAAGPPAKPGIPIDKVKNFYSGVFYSPVLVTGPFGTLNPDPTKARPLQVPFVMSVPTTAMPAGGWPITIFGHGLTRSRNDFLKIANALSAQGQVVIAMDGLDHGDRTTCTGAGPVLIGKGLAGSTDDTACDQPSSQKCDEDPVFSSCVLKDDTMRAACDGADPINRDVSCALKGQGHCAADGKCQGGPATPTKCTTNAAGQAMCASLGLGLCGGIPGNTICLGSPAHQWRDAAGEARLSGYNFFSITNFFTTRDNFREQVIDLEMLMQIIKSTTEAAGIVPANLQSQVASISGAPFKIDLTKINYAGQSLGSILGTLWNSASPDTNNVALNVGGGALVKLFLDSPTLAEQKAALIAALDSQGVKAGTPQFDQVLGFAQWILDAADPANMAYRLTHPANGAPNANRKVLLQFIKDDQFVINESNFALVAGANRAFDPKAAPSFNCTGALSCYEFIDQLEGFDATSAPLASRHGFLLIPPSGAAPTPLEKATAKAQSQVSNFIATGTFTP